MDRNGEIPWSCLAPGGARKAKVWPPSDETAVLAWRLACLDLWIYDGTLDRIHYALYEACREQAGGEASPTACIIDSYASGSLRMRVRKAPKKGGRASIHLDSTQAILRGSQEIKGKKRHILVDAEGLLLHAVVHEPIFKIATEEYFCWPRSLACFLF